MIKVDSFRLKFGSSPESPQLNIKAASVNIFVGPNASGKSLFLAELKRRLQDGDTGWHNKILNEVQFSPLSEDRFDHEIANISSDFQPTSTPGMVWVYTRNGLNQVSTIDLKTALTDLTSNNHNFIRWFIADRTLHLDGTVRTAGLGEISTIDLKPPVKGTLHKLFLDDDRRAELRAILHETFGIHFTVDPTYFGKLTPMMASRAPTDPLEERGFHDAAIKYHSSSRSFSEASDGVRAFTSIMGQIIAGDPRIILIDEPEAFLHPALASKLGFYLSNAAASTGKYVFAATHSPAFLMGCIQSCAPVNIIRLTHANDTATARLLSSDELLPLMRNPLLRSMNVLSSLFYDYVIVTEGDADRAFYQEVNERLLRSNSGRGIPHCLFINAQNKQSIRTIVKPLRSLGIPAAGIVDIDVVKDGGKTWTELLACAGVPQISHGPLAAQRTAINEALANTGLNMKIDGGIRILSPADREAARNLFDQLASYGIFVVPDGELESWLEPLGVDGHGPNWLVDMFQRMGEDPSRPDYVHPAHDDVWTFMDAIHSWMLNPNRKGIPYN